MFTWIPIHEEIARRLPEFKDRQQDLIAILARMHSAGMKASSITDKDATGKEFQLKEIDPFTFFANFNRRVRDDNRQAMWQFLKDEWNLTSDVPADFDGLPLADMRSSWLMPYAAKRAPEHVGLLWNFYEHMLHSDADSIDAILMQQCLDLRKVGLAFLTMGMFWACPRKWIATDGKNLGFAKTKGILEKPETASDYLLWLPKIRKAIGGDGVEFSRQAHLWAIGGASGSYASPFNKIFPDNQPDRILDYLGNVIGLLKEESANPDDLLSMTLRKQGGAGVLLRINIWMWAITAIVAKPNQRLIEFLVPWGHPEALRLANQMKADGRAPYEGFAEAVNGVRYTSALLDESEFFDRIDELWPTIEACVRAISRHFSGRRSPFRANHRPELEALCLDKNQRETILNSGLSFRTRPIDPDSNELQYWLISPGEGARLWESWQDQGIAAIGSPEIGNLCDYETKENIVAKLNQQSRDQNNSQQALMLWNISHEMKKGDIVFAKLGRSEIIGWGELTGDYSFAGDHEEYAHVVPVDWVVKKPAKLTDRKLAYKALTNITDSPKLRKMLAALYPSVPGLSKMEPENGNDENTDGNDGEDDGETKEMLPYSIDDAVGELFMSRNSLEHILEQLKRKKNIILQGAPGVGKTFVARRLAWLLLGAKDESAVEMVQFHQSYTYEDFVQGLRPTPDGHFAVKDGCFYRLCRKALANSTQEYVLIIDEINRGNLSKILGELMMLIETDKRGESLTLAYSDEPFTVPPKVYLIGTMNTADRSLSMVDYALRRRFAFLTLDPGFGEDAFSAHLGKHGLNESQSRHVINQMEALNHEIEKDDVNLGKGYRIGHSFFTPTASVPDFQKWFDSIVRYEIMPLLEEYWIDYPAKVKQFRDALLESIP